MLKVLIADDEPRIRKGIRGSLDWNSMGFEVVAEAEDGEEALEKARELMPDLLLVDICMPFLNGLQLISQINKVIQQPTIIIISGHDEFKYAQTALQLNVFDYILKPVDQDNLREAVLHAKEKIIYKKNKKTEADFTKRQLKKSKYYLKNQFMQTWVHEKLEREEIMREIAYFNIGYTQTMGIVAVKILDKKVSIGEEEWGSELLSYAGENILREIMVGFEAVTTFIDYKNQIIAISDFNPVEKWWQIAHKVEHYINEYLKQEVLVEIAVLPGDVMDLPEAYKVVTQQLIEKSQKTPIVVTIQKYIDKHYGDPNLSLTQIADKIGISQTYLTRLLKQELGLPFIDYLTQVRIKNALFLMQDPHIKLYEVAERVGYSSQHYFSNVFKKVLNSSPVDYKRGGKR